MNLVRAWQVLAGDSLWIPPALGIACAGAIALSHGGFAFAGAFFAAVSGIGFVASVFERAASTGK